MARSSFRFSSCFLLCILAGAQTPDTSSIHGSIVDKQHVAVAGAKVTVTNSLIGLTRQAESSSNGEFWFAGLPAGGGYQLKALKEKFSEAELLDLTLGGGNTADIRLELSVAGGRTEISVTGIPGEIRTDQPQLGDRLGQVELNSIPLLNRRITYLPLLNAANRPAINQGDVFMNQNMFTTNGAGRRQTWFEIDGATGNDTWGRQTLMTNIPLAGVAEMTILTNEFSAEYGGSTGSAVNIVTKSGGNQLQGEVLGLWRPSGPEAKLSGFNSTNAANGNSITNDTLGQAALSISGPIGESGRTHYLFAGEYNQQERASPVTSPLSPYNFIGRYRDWLGLLRVDHQVNDRNNVFLRSSADAFYDTNPNGTVGGNNLPSVGRVFRRRTYSEEIGETATLSSSMVNNLRVQFQLASPITKFDPIVYGTQYSVPISTGGTFTSGTSQSALLMNRQYEAADTLAVVHGRHQLKFGFDFIYAHTGGNSKEFGGPIYLGQFVYNTCTQSVAFCESPAFLNNLANVRTYTQSYGNANYTVNDKIWSLFVQEDFRIRPDLTINLGMRYEQQTYTDSRLGFAPRVGFAYDWGGRSKAVLRGGFGLYQSQIVDNAEANYALTGPTGVFNYTASPGQVGFPISVTAAPLPALPASAAVPLRTLYIRPGRGSYLNQFFPTSTLVGYPDQLLNPYSEQWTLGLQQELKANWILSLDYVGSHTIRINRPLDVDAPSPFIRTAPGQTRTPQAANCTRPYWIWWYQQRGTACNPATATNPQPPYSVIQSDVNNGYAYYHALDVSLSHRFRHGFSMLASYTWSHAINNVDPDVPGQNPNDANFTGRVENASAIFDQRQRLVLSGVYQAPFHISIGGINTMGSALPYNFTTGTTNSGDTGATTDRPVINGVVIGRNAGRGRPIDDFSPFIEAPIPTGMERIVLTLRVESFNVLNHANFVGYSGTWGNGATAGAGFGQPLTGITNQLPARSMQFSARVNF